MLNPNDARLFVALFVHIYGQLTERYSRKENQLKQKKKEEEEKQKAVRRMYA